MTLKVSREYMAQSRRSLIVSRATSDDWWKVTIHSEMTLWDIDCYNKFLYAKVLTQLFSIFEKCIVGSNTSASRTTTRNFASTQPAPRLRLGNVRH